MDALALPAWGGTNHIAVMVSVIVVSVGVTVVRVSVGVVPGTERSGQPVLGDLATADGDRGFRGVLITPEGVLARGQSGIDRAVDDPGRGGPGVDLVVATGRGWVGHGHVLTLGIRRFRHLGGDGPG